MYQTGNFKQAKVLFEALCQISPEDDVFSLYAQRLELLESQQPSPDWQGIWKFTEKF